MRSKRRIELDDAQGRTIAMEEFLLHLHRGSELLRNNKPKDAQRHMVMAFDSQVDDPTGQATLALVYFKLGLYPRAIEILRKLYDSHSNEPVIMLNLALVLFKTGQTMEAKKILEDVVVLSPNYRKAYGYLGLAYQRLGDYHKAEDAFKKAGLQHMATRMAHFIEPLFDTEAPDLPTPLNNHSPADHENDQNDPSAKPQSHATPFVANPLMHLAEPSMTEPMAISELLTLARQGEPLEGRFLVSSKGYLLMNVEERVLTRLEGIHFCSSEGLSYQPLMRNYRNNEDEIPFGINSCQLYSAEGTGRLGFHPGDGVFSAVSIRDENTYLREDMVFAFDPTLAFEHGSLPDEKTPLVNFKGKGSVIFKTPVATQALEITHDQGVIIPANGLVGWFGQLVPNSSPLDSPFDSDQKALEFTGEGVLFFFPTS